MNLPKFQIGDRAYLKMHNTTGTITALSSSGSFGWIYKIIEDDKDLRNDPIWWVQEKDLEKDVPS